MDRLDSVLGLRARVKSRGRAHGRVYKLGSLLRRSAGVLGLGVLLTTSGCVSAFEFTTYTRVQVKNPLGVGRDQETVEIPLDLIRAQFPGFYESDFSVHVMSTNLYPHGDPLLALEPIPEVPTQLIDRNLDGAMDTLLLSLDFAPREKKYLAVASPRFWPRAERPASQVNTGLWQREVVRGSLADPTWEGSFTPAPSVVLPPSHQPGDGLYFLDGMFLESESLAYRVSFDGRLAADVIGKRVPGLHLEELARSEEATEALSHSWGGSLLGEPTSFGAGSLAMVEGDQVLPLPGFNSLQFRQVSNGPVAAESEVLISGCRVGDQAYDLKWRITAYRGQRYLRHDLSVNRLGHQLGFAVRDGGAERRVFPSSRFGWMRALSFGPQNVLTDLGGALGMAVMFPGRQSSGYAKGPSDVMGIQFDSLLADFQWVVVGAWDQEPVGPKSMDEFQLYIEELAQRFNNPIKVRAMDRPEA